MYNYICGEEKLSGVIMETKYVCISEENTAIGKQVTALLFI
jgi:hypothetical protein